MRQAILERYSIEKDRIFLEANVMGRLFATSIWYKDVDFTELKKDIGDDSLKRLVAHIAAFEMNKYGSLHLECIDLGDLSTYVDEPLVSLWQSIFLHVWAQWRFENGLPHDKPPRLIARSTGEYPLFRISGSTVGTLTFFGGGKDSFVSSHLLQMSRIPFDVLEYSNSIYGNRTEQSDVKEVAQLSSPKSNVREIAVYDDFLDSPIIEYDGETYKIHSLAAAETPASIFEAIPISLHKGYAQLALGHEKSANYPNLQWKLENMNPINHQWGKSLEAQKQIADYIQDRLVHNLTYYSTLMPLSDPAIFTLFSKLPWTQVAKAHSCNVVKPWCRRCAKCVYVWLFYLAFLDEQKVTHELFDNEVLFDITDNHETLRMLAGLKTQTPFECVGQPPESRLAIAICQKKGFNQPIVREIMERTSANELDSTIQTQLSISPSFLEQCRLPQTLRDCYKTTVSTQLAAKKRELETLFKLPQTLNERPSDQ